jgi:transposase InsO family protein
MAHIRAIIREHPGYGYRRILPELRERTGERVNHKRLRRLLSEHELGLTRCLPKKRPSPVRQILREATGKLNLVNQYTSTDRTPAPLEVLSTDFTELRYSEGQRKAYLMTMLDVGSRVALGWSVGPSPNGALARTCLERARRRTNDLQRNLQGTIVHSDQDSVYTSYAWLREVLLGQGMRVSYSDRGARGNPWIESLWGRLKTELGSRIDQARSLPALREIISDHLRYYNRDRRHSSIGNVPPLDRLTTTVHQGKPEPSMTAAT